MMTLQRPHYWSAHAFERLAERYPDHVFAQEALDAIVPRIEDAHRDIFDRRAVPGGRVAVDVAVPSGNAFVVVRLIYNYIGQRVFTTLKTSHAQDQILKVE
jgi:hypothetical protein